MGSDGFNAVEFLAGLFGGPAADAGPEPDPEPGITPDDLSANWREVFEERAAIREFEGGQAREHAEAEALREVLTAMRAARA